MSSIVTELNKIQLLNRGDADFFANVVGIDGDYIIAGAQNDDRNSTNSGSAFIYKRSGSNWGAEVSGETYRTETVELHPSDLDTSDFEQFGRSVAISGNYAIVGCRDRSSTTESSTSITEKGSVYIFERDSNDNWGTAVNGETYRNETVKLLASDLQANDRFGYSVAISGNYAIIGNYNSTDKDRGAVYIFERDGNGNWGTAVAGQEYRTETVKLVPSDFATGDYFGSRVAISGNYAIIGAWGKDHQPDASVTWKYSDFGTAYIYERDSNGVWNQVVNLFPSINVANKFGFSVAISGNYAMVGSPNENNGGALYMYERDSEGNWGTAVNDQTYRHETVKLFASDRASGDNLGWVYGISISGNYAIAGAALKNNKTGSAYLFVRDNNGNWGTAVNNETYRNETEIIEPSTTISSNSQYGRSVAISGNYAVIGMGESTYTGSAFTFQIGDVTSTSTAETALTDLSVESTDIGVLKTGGTFSVSDGKSTLDNTRKNKLKSIISGATGANKRKRRRAALKLLFEQESTLTKMVVPKSDLELPTTFSKDKALVVKAGQTFTISTLESDEGFYAVLDDDESVSFTTENTTLTFTRSDVGDNELYGVNATSWTDIVINTDGVSTGTFAEETKNGTLAPDDIVIIDGRKFFIGSVGDGGAAGSGGDPYIFPIKSNVPLKLPNKPAVYRMFEQGDNYVNVEVGRATDEHKQRMFNYAKQITPVTHNIVMDGYFYQKAFISAEGHKLTIDYTTKKANCDESAKEFFTIKQSKKHFDCGEFKEHANNWTIGWTTKENKKIQVQLMFFPNPHIENGINVIPSTLKNSTGLIVENFKPKLMELPSLTTEKFGKLHRRMKKAKRVHQKMSIKGKNEKWHFN